MSTRIPTDGLDHACACGAGSFTAWNIADDTAWTNDVWVVTDPNGRIVDDCPGCAEPLEVQE